MRVSMYFFGDENEVAIRLPSFISGIACLWLIYLTSCAIFRSQLIANFALLAAALNPIHILYSQTARGYGLLMFLSILTLFALIKFLETKHFVR
jgi:uncharacterized membrane protein